MGKPINKILGIFSPKQLFGGGDEAPAPVAPTIAAAPPVPVMPIPDADAQAKARQTTLRKMHQRRGRQSTIMSDYADGVETLG